MCRMETTVFPNCLSQKIMLQSGYQVMFPVPGGDKLLSLLPWETLFVILTDSNICPCFFNPKRQNKFAIRETEELADERK